MSKLDVGKFPFNPRACDLTTIVKTSIDDVSGIAIEKDIKIAFKSDKPPVIAQCDEEQINQVLRNVLSNALKFSEEHSTIEVALETDSGCANIEVIDSGIGIPEDELETVFQKFVQSSKTNSGAGGTGLGLTLCREFVSLHQGTIKVCNNELGGATISIQVPLEINLDEYLADEQLVKNSS